MNEDLHIVSSFDRDLEEIQAHIMKMGGLVEEAILDASQSLIKRDEELSQQVRERDAAIDALEELINDGAVFEPDHIREMHSPDVFD